MIEVLAYVVAGYVGLLTLNMVAILIDQLIWKIHKIVTPRKDDHVEEQIDEIWDRMDAYTFNVYNLITLSELPSNITTIFSSIAILIRFDWYLDTTDYMGAVDFVRNVDDNLHKYDSRDRAALLRFKESRIESIEKYRKNYPRTTKLLWWCNGIY